MQGLIDDTATKVEPLRNWLFSYYYFECASWCWQAAMMFSTCGVEMCVVCISYTWFHAPPCVQKWRDAGGRLVVDKRVPVQLLLWQRVALGELGAPAPTALAP
jgi:hypothetical protein